MPDKTFPQAQNPVAGWLRGDYSAWAMTCVILGETGTERFSYSVALESALGRFSKNSQAWERILNNPHAMTVVIDPPQRTLGTEAPSLAPEQSLANLLNGFLDTIVRMTGARAGAIRFLSDSAHKNELALGASYALPQEIMRCESCVPLTCGVCGQAAVTGKISATSSSYCAQRSGEDFFAEDCLGVVAIPLDFGNHCLGVFTLFFETERALDERTQQLLTAYADLIGQSLNHARLTQENQRINLMAERQAIANEIHDSLSQTLFYARLRMSVLNEALHSGQLEQANDCVSDLGEALNQAQKSVRDLITHFRSPMDPLGLHHALQMLIEGLKVRSSITFDFQHPRQQAELTLEQELQVFHILREALHNIATHSQATWAHLVISHEPGSVQFLVTDNGIGMDQPFSPIGHYGLTIMHERARRIGAVLDIHTAADVGTQITLTLPISRSSIHE